MAHIKGHTTPGATTGPKPHTQSRYQTVAFFTVVYLQARLWIILFSIHS